MQAWRVAHDVISLVRAAEWREPESPPRQRRGRRAEETRADPDSDTDSSETDSTSTADGEGAPQQPLRRAWVQSEWFQAMPATIAEPIRRRNDRVRPRNLPEELTADEQKTLTGHLLAFLETSKSEGRWSDLRSVADQFGRWDECNRHLSAFARAPLDFRMCAWIQYKMMKKDITRGTPAEYCKRLHYLYRMSTGASSDLMKQFGAAVRRDPSLRSQQAHPLSKQQLDQLLGRVETDEEYVYFLVMWLTASRAADMLRLTPQGILAEEGWNTIEGRRISVMITWLTGVKNSYYAHTDYLALEPGAARRAIPWLMRRARRGADVPLFTFTQGEVTIALRHYLHDRRLTAHSVKRGSLQYLIDTGTSLQSVMYKAKHQDEKTTRGYLAPEAYARAMGAWESAQAY